MNHSGTLRRERTDTPISGRPFQESARIEIVLAYHQTVVRSGLRMLLDGVRDFEVVAEASDTDTAQRQIENHAGCVLVLDLDFPEGSSVEAIELIHRDAPGTAIVVMSVRRDAVFVRKAISDGALGYVPNTAPAQELMQAVRQAASGRTYLAPQLGPLDRPDATLNGPSLLSRREIEVLSLLAMGHTNPEIAEQLCLSVRTIETHRSHIRQKLECPTRAELVAYAFQHGMGSLEKASKIGR